MSARPSRVGAYPGSFDPPTRAHLAVAEAARHQLHLDVVELVISVDPLGKHGPSQIDVRRRLDTLAAVAAERPWLAVRSTQARLLVDIAEGAAALVVGADKWAQLVDPSWYGSVADRDAALARLPVVGVAPRPPHPLPESRAGRVVRLAVDPVHHEVSSTAVREGRHDWALPEAAHLLADPDTDTDSDAGAG